MAEPRKIARYGWVPDLPDHRDHLMVTAPTLSPDIGTVEAHDPPIWDQGHAGSCVGHESCRLWWHAAIASGVTPFQPSRLLAYWDARALEGTTRQDAGASIRDGIKGLAARGVCPESLWPYDVRKVTTRPTKMAFSEAGRHQVLDYRRLPQTSQAIEQCVTEGFPVGFGFTVFDSFESPEVAASGVVPMPAAGDVPIGGHAVVIVGYDRPAQQFRVANSWGTGWGQAGYCQMPYAYITDRGLAADFWTVRAIETT
jgi:C1A family cysteine protease